MTELAQILAHNVLHGALFQTTNEIVGHELDRMQDGYRHTWWQAPSTASQAFNFRVKNLIYNFGFESNINDWYVKTAAAGAGTIVRNTTGPISGLADVDFTTTVADNAADVVIMTNYKPLFFRANRTYRMMFQADAVGVNKNIRWGFLNESFNEDVTLYDTGVAVVGGSGHHKDITPTSDGWYHVYVRMEAVGTVYFDDFVCNEVRDVDTLVIDAGHKIALASIAVQYRNDEHGAWVVAQAAFNHTNNEPVYKAFTGVKALSWRIVIGVLSLVGDIPVAQVPMLYLGHRWEMPNPFLGSFDPNENKRVVNTSISERGIRQDVLKYNQRLFKASIPNVTPTEYLDIEYFYEDTENSLHPFFFIWKPTTYAWDITPMLAKRGELAPYSWYNRRGWTLDAEEVIGKRRIF